MSTKGVPGSKAAPQDKLSRGCWAEKGAELVLVEQVKTPTVVYLSIDAKKAAKPAAMAQVDFEKQFEGWTWHDKTPFPWDRVLK